jgi:alpha-amylase
MQQHQRKGTPSTILRIVPDNRAFYFSTPKGKYIGEVALSLSDFQKKIETIPLPSVEFHFQRGDFQKWIQEIVGDLDLATRMRKVNQSLQGRALKEQLHQILTKRITFLKKELASKKKFVKHF